MSERPQRELHPAFQLWLDDANLCPHGPVPLNISSLSGSGLAVLTVQNQPALLNATDLLHNSTEGRPLRLTAQIGARSIGVTARLVWSDPASPGTDQLELIVDAAGTSDWPTIVAAYRGAP